MTLQQLLQQIVTTDGGVRADFALVVAISIIGTLILILGALVWGQIKAMARALKSDVTEIKEDLKGMADLVRTHDNEIAVLKSKSKQHR